MPTTKSRADYKRAWRKRNAERLNQRWRERAAAKRGGAPKRKCGPPKGDYGARGLTVEDASTPAVQRRFWAKVNKDGPTQANMDTPCWEWTRALRHGYGILRVVGRNVPAHHVSVAIHGAPIPHGLIVMHHCDNRACVRPEHLKVATQAENLKDAVAKGRLVLTARRGAA